MKNRTSWSTEPLTRREFNLPCPFNLQSVVEASPPARGPVSFYVSPRMNLNAPIVPGVEAAGIILGSQVAELISAERPDSVRQLHACDVFEYRDVKIWADPTTGIIEQLAVYGGYTGMTSDGLKIGTTLREVAEKIGRPYEGDEDCLMIEGLLGIALETSEWRREYYEAFGEYDPDAEVTHIFVIQSRQGGEEADADTRRSAVA